MKRVLGILLALGTVLLLVSCNAGSEKAVTTEERVEQFLTSFFTAPDEKAEELFGPLFPLTGVDHKYEEAMGEYGEYLKTVYDPESFTEDFYNGLIQSGGVGSFVPIMVCIPMDVQIKPASVTVEKNTEDTFRYTAEITITGQAGDSAVTQEGRVQVDDSGRISWMDPDFGALQSALMPNS